MLVSAPALELFSEHLLEHVLVEREIGNQRLQFLVLIFELSKSGQPGDAHPGELTFPPVAGLLRDARLATDFGDGCAAFNLPQSVDDLLVGKRLLDASSSGLRTVRGSRNPNILCVQFFGDVSIVPLDDLCGTRRPMRSGVFKVADRWQTFLLTGEKYLQ